MAELEAGTGARESRPKLSTAQRIAAAFGTVTLVLVAFKALMAVIPDTVTTTQRAVDAMRGMFPPQQTNLPNVHPAEAIANSNPNTAIQSATPAAAIDPPQRGCTEIMSMDDTVFPPKAVKLQRCPGN